MELLSLIIQWFSIFLEMYAFVKVYDVMTFNKVKINFISFFLMLLSALMILYANYNFSSVYIVVISFSLAVFVLKINFNESFKILLFKLFLIYLLVSICDFLLYIIFLFFPTPTSLPLEEGMIIKAFGTILLSLLFLLVTYSKIFFNISNYLLKNILKKWNFIFILLAFLAFVSFMIITYIGVLTFNPKTYFISLVLMIFFIALCVIMLYLYFKTKSVQDERESLLSLMSEYEKVLENDRINRHEILNNLIVLKSFEDKNNSEYADILDSLIEEYQVKKSKFYSNLSKLPSGIKGVIYFKTGSVNKKDLDFNLLISSEINEWFNEIDNKLYFKVCKILGILLDNAIEASIESQEKYLLVDMYIEDGNAIIYMENSFINDIDLDTINQKGKSSKGENRGYGLYIVSKLLRSVNELEFEQKINNKVFVTILKIKKP